MQDIAVKRWPFHSPQKVLAVLASSFPFLLFAVWAAAVWPGCCFVVCAPRAKYWSQWNQGSSALQGRGKLSEEDYSLALIVSSRCSQQHKSNGRALYFLLNAALLRVSWWDVHLFWCLLDDIIMTEGCFKTRYCIYTDLMYITYKDNIPSATSWNWMQSQGNDLAGCSVSRIFPCEHWL